MPTPWDVPDYDEERFDEELRQGVRDNPDEQLERELELADRIAEQASLPPGHPDAIAAARDLLGNAPCPSPRPHESANGSWHAAAYGGHVVPSHPGADRVAVDVLLRDGGGDHLRLTACGFTVDDAVAAAADYAVRRFGSDYASCDWRAR